MTNIDHAPFVNSVFHLTDFTEESERAFAHALGIALLRQGELKLLHVGNTHLSGNEWHRFPAARATLEKWGVLEEGSTPADVQKKTGVKIEKIDLVYGNVKKAVKEYLKYHPMDLLVLSSGNTSGFVKALKGSVAEKLATETQIKTLFVPNQAKSFINLDTGEISLRKILIPVDHEPNPSAVIQYAIRAAHFAQATGNEAEIILLHVGSDFNFKLHLPADDSSVKFQHIEKNGDVVKEILSTANEISADLIIMATHGQDGFMDMLRGSITKKILHSAPCPVLSVPGI